jgi:hypothetical protein
MIFAPSVNNEIINELPEDGTTISSIDSNDSKTIISKDKWDILSLDELISQRTIIYDKMIFLKSSNYDWYSNFEKLYNEIDTYIGNKV